MFEIGIEIEYVGAYYASDPHISGGGETLPIRCPACENPFWMLRGFLKEEALGKPLCCPYCNYTAVMPDELPRLRFKPFVGSPDA